VEKTLRLETKNAFHFAAVPTTDFQFYQGLLRREEDEKTVPRRVGKPGDDKVSFVTA
jgi:hypothetical protein